MSATGLAVFDRTLQETNLWLKELMARLGTDDRAQAYGILKATLHALRDRIGPESATHLAAQLPILLRGVYYEGWRIAGTPSRERHVEAWGRLDQGEVAKAMRMLPAELRELWTGIHA